MGLTIDYRFRARVRGPAAARELVARLRNRACELPFARVGELVELTNKQCGFQRLGRDDPRRWLLLQAGFPTDRTVRGRAYRVRVPPVHLIAFSTWPGEGCEAAHFGLCRFPATVETPDAARLRGTFRLATRLGPDWRWSGSFWTQDAAEAACGGAANFVRCHLAVIGLLDAAQDLGMLDRVIDEGGYWDDRDAAALAAAVALANALLPADRPAEETSP